MTRYVTLAEYFWLAEQVIGIEADTLAKASRSDLADSALHAPQAGFGNVEFYSDRHDKAAVLVCRLAWNHPLPDGNKRAAWAQPDVSLARRTDRPVRATPPSSSHHDTPNRICAGVMVLAPEVFLGGPMDSVVIDLGRAGV